MADPPTDAVTDAATDPHPRWTAVVTGASRGLGLAVTTELVRRGWHVIVDGRDAAALHRAVSSLPEAGVTAVPGDVCDPLHRERLRRAAATAGGLRLVVNNASILGPSPQPGLADYPVDQLRMVFEVNVVAPLALLQRLLPLLDPGGARVVNVSSDAGIEAYAGWGGYGSSKAALDHLSAVLAVEHPQLRIYALDPGDMNTRMHQDAFPGQDISDLPSPQSVVPAFMVLVDADLPSGRYRAGDLAAHRQQRAHTGQVTEVLA